MKFYEKSVLENGIRVITQELNYTKTISLGIWVNVGSRDENKAINGISHFIEHCVFKGTKNKSNFEISSSLEKLGGYLNAFTTKEHTCFYARTLSEHFSKAFKVLSELVLTPQFPPNEIEKERLVILEEISSMNDTPDDVIFDLVEKELFGEHPLGLPVTGDSENIMRFNSNFALKFMRENYSADKIIVNVVGPVKHNDSVGLTRKYLGGLKQLYSNNVRKTPSLKNRPVIKEIVKDISQVHICIARKTFGFKDKRRTELALLNTLLGGMSSSRLFYKIREQKGIAYNIFSFLNNYFDASVFGVYLSTTRKNRQRVIDLIQNEFKKISKNSITRTELERAKSFLKGTISMSMENPSMRATHVAIGEFYQNKANSIDEILEIIDKIQIDDFQSVAEEILSWEDYTIYQIIPESGGNNGN